MQRKREIVLKPFRVKVCGVTSVEDASLVVSAGADAVGLNFFPRSPRYVGYPVAQRIGESLPDHVAKVGLFVNASAEEIRRAFTELDLHWVQLHGDEPPDMVARLDPLPVIRAFRLRDDSLSVVADYLSACDHLGFLPAMVLIDAFSPSQYGGTGKVAKWSVAARYAQHTEWPPLVLAGGLTADNVAEAIRTVRPAAVDSASGVEESPGKKHPQKTRRFVTAAKQAFDGLR